MSWVGVWRNQYGSHLEITSEESGRIRGGFRTALTDSAFFGSEYEISGAHRGNCISFTFAGSTPKGDMICTFTGLLRAGKLQTVWHVVADSTRNADDARSWAHAVMTNADTFVRVDSAHTNS